MCGIVAIVAKPPALSESIVNSMTRTLLHRGPDEGGLAVFEGEGVGLGMRRLSILDLEGGHQPMWNETQTVGLVFNGEIYNFAELRDKLVCDGHIFATDHSDTEVLVHGYEEWQEGLFERLNGMFAVAIWDRLKKRLVVSRDRTGEKPLYIAKLATGYAVASELKALLAHPAVARRLDFVALEEYLAFDFILPPRSILKDVQKLPAAHYAILSHKSLQVRPYWSLGFDARVADSGHAVDMLDSLMEDSVAMRMVADVPLGLFLSGGLDSTTIGYYMRRISPNVRSFSIGFEEPAYDESAYALKAARHLGTDHHLEIFSQSRVANLVPQIAEILDEPMADQSIFPTYLVSRVARESVKVALGGDGSDELLMGYKTYKALKVSSEFDRLPLWLRKALAKGVRAMPSTLAGIKVRGKVFGERLASPPLHRLLSHLGSYRGTPDWILSSAVRSSLPRPALDEASLAFALDLERHRSPANQAIAAYIGGYLQEDILVKVDRASMAASLEVRSPFLDPRIIEFLAGVSPSLKLKGMTGKYLLRRLMRGRIPNEIIDRPKHGFGVPINAWLRESLAPLLLDFLSEGTLKRDGIFDAAAVGALLKEHVYGRRDRGQELWPLLLFQMWKERWLDVASGTVGPSCLGVVATSRGTLTG